MAFDCNRIRTELARQTPVYDEVFLDDFISGELVTDPFMGRHRTRGWSDGKDTLFYDKLHVRQPDYTDPWQRINSEECGNACNPPQTTVGWGTTRDSVFMEQKDLNSQPFCLQQLRGIPHVGEQITKMYKIIREIPASFTSDFLRTRFTSYHDTLQIAGSSLNTFTITSANTDANLTTLNLGSSALLPTSQLTLPLMNTYSQKILMRGYSKESGMPNGMINLVTHSLQYADLVGMNPALRGQLYSTSIKSLSPLYRVGEGINAEPFGNIMPTFDEKQIRFQHAGNGLLQRVYPYLNTPATTGEKPVENPAWLNARYAISYILHPMAAVLYTPEPKKIHPMVPTVNSAMFGKWTFVNNQGIIRLPNPDGTYCDKDNTDQFWFFWRAHLELGFRYDQRELVFPILHQINGIGASCLVDSPACGAAASYVVQDYDGAGQGFCST